MNSRLNDNPSLTKIQVPFAFTPEFLPKYDIHIQKSPVSRVKAFWQKSSLLSFFAEWIIICINFIVLPIGIIFVVFVYPLGRLYTFIISIPHKIYYSIVLRHIPNKNIEHISGIERFWLGKSTNDSSFTRHSGRLVSTSVVVWTMEQLANKNLQPVKHFQKLINDNIVKAKHPTSAKILYPRFSEILKKTSFGHLWITDTKFDIDHHIFQVLSEPSSTKDFLDFISQLSSTPFWSVKPRWRMYYICNYPGKKDTVVFNFDPAMGDGIYMVDLFCTRLSDKTVILEKFNYGASFSIIETVRSFYNGTSWFFNHLLIPKFKSMFNKDTVVDLNMPPQYPPNYDMVLPSNVDKDDEQSFSQYLRTVGEKVNLHHAKRGSFKDHVKVLLQQQPGIKLENIRKTLISGPISIESLDGLRDVTKCSLDEIILTVITASLRDYYKNFMGFENPYDTSASIMVSLQDTCVANYDQSFRFFEQTNLSQSNIGTFRKVNDRRKADTVSTDSTSKGYVKNIAIKDVTTYEMEQKKYVCKKPDYHKNSSSIRMQLPTSVEGVMAQMWRIRYRIREEKLMPNHISFHQCCNMLYHLMSDSLFYRCHRKLLNNPEVEYSSLVGPSNEIKSSGRPVKSIFFWGPVRRNESIGVSMMRYQDNVTLTLSINSKLKNPELLLYFVDRKLHDLRELVKLRRVRFQPRIDTHFVPFTNKNRGSIASDVGEEIPLGNPVFKKSISAVAAKRHSIFALSTLLGTRKKSIEKK